MKTHWKKSRSEDVVGFEIYKNNRLLYTTTKLHFTKTLHPKDYYKHHLYGYKEYLKSHYKLRAVTSAGSKSKFRHLSKVYAGNS